MGSTSGKRPVSDLEISTPTGERLLTKPEFQRLSEVPPEVEWFANLENENTRRAYRNDVGAFMRFVGIRRPEEFRSVTRAHVIAWRKVLEQRKLAPATIRRKLSALADLYNYLCDANAVPHNPVNGVERPTEGANEGKTPALSDEQANALLSAPPPRTLKGKRDRAILAVFLFHAVRRAEHCSLRVKDYSERRGVKHFCVHGNGAKIRYAPEAIQLLEVLRVEPQNDINPRRILHRVQTPKQSGVTPLKPQRDKNHSRPSEFHESVLRPGGGKNLSGRCVSRLSQNVGQKRARRGSVSKTFKAASRPVLNYPSQLSFSKD